MELQSKVTSDRTLAIRGTKKVVRKVERNNLITHSSSIHIQMNVSEFSSPKLPIVLNEPRGVPKRFKDDVVNYTR